MAKDTDGLSTIELVGSGWLQLRRLRMRVGTRDAPHSELDIAWLVIMEAS